MTEVDRITDNISQIPVAAFIFRDQESDEVHFSADIRWTFKCNIDKKESVKS